MATEEENGGKLVWFLAGAAIGAAIALLYAPKSGRETREAIKGLADEGKTFVRDNTKEVVERGKDLYEKGRSIAQEAADLFEKGRKLVEEKAASAD